MLEKLFKLQEHKTNVKTEALAGFTTFLTMMYIVPVNGFILADAGMPIEAVITATALITILATLFNGLWANTPIAMSVGMGLNAYFAYGLVLGMHIAWQTALGIVFLSGVIFLVLSFTNFRLWIMTSIPMPLRNAISAGIGAFIAFIALKQMGIVVPNSATVVGIGRLDSLPVLLGIFGLVVNLVLYSFKVKGSFIISVLVTALLGWSLGIGEFPKEIVSLPASVSPLAFKLDIFSALSLSLLPVIIAFLVTDMFDSLGTLTGIGSRAGFFNESKESKELSKTLEADAAATVAGSVLGMPTTTAFIESASGVEAGGRTGLTSVFTALFFVSTLFFMPFFKSIPSNAIYPVLLLVGVLMFKEVGRIEFSKLDLATTAAVFLTVLMMPLSFSITNGIACGFGIYTLIKILTGKLFDLNVGIVFITALSSLVFFVH